MANAELLIVSFLADTKQVAEFELIAKCRGLAMSVLFGKALDSLLMAPPTEFEAPLVDRDNRQQVFRVPAELVLALKALSASTRVRQSVYLREAIYRSVAQ